MGLLFSCMNPFWHLTHLSLLHLPSSCPVLLSHAAPPASTALWSQGRVFVGSGWWHVPVHSTPLLYKAPPLSKQIWLIHIPLQTCPCWHVFFRFTIRNPHPELPKHQELDRSLHHRLAGYLSRKQMAVTSCLKHPHPTALTAYGTLLTLSHVMPSLWQHLTTFCHQLRSHCDKDPSRRAQAVRSIASAFVSRSSSNRQTFHWRNSIVSCICKLNYPKLNII